MVPVNLNGGLQSSVTGYSGSALAVTPPPRPTQKGIVFGRSSNVHCGPIAAGGTAADVGVLMVGVPQYAGPSSTAFMNSSIVASV